MQSALSAHARDRWLDGVSLPANPGRRSARDGLRHPTWTRDTVIVAIKRWARRHGQPPTKTQWMQRSTRGPFVPGKPGSRPSARQVARLFGSWNAAIEAAGFAPRVRGGTSDNFYSRRSHCKHGHAFTTENTLLRKDGARLCRTCINESNRRRRAA